MTESPTSGASTTWTEKVAADEDERFARQAQQIAEVQRVKSEKYGAGRTLHRRQRLALNAVLEVLPDLPEPAAQGLFARPGPHDVLVRLSNGGTDRAKDSVPDIRGFAIKVLGVTGPGALGFETSTQDFLLINHSVFSVPTSTEFVDLVSASAKGRLALVGHAVRTHGPFGGLATLKTLAGTLGVPFTGFATETFWSALPIANGPYAVRVRLVPVDPGPPAATSDWAADMSARLAAGPLTYDLQLQFFTDEAATPIEDPTVDWPTPYLTVARLTIPVQDPASEHGVALQAEAEGAAFDPWSALIEHRPLGEIMRARKVAYRASQLGRGLS